VKAAVQQSQADEAVVRSFLALPASRDIDSSAAQLMLLSLAQGPGVGVLIALLQMLPAAGHMHPLDLAQVLRWTFCGARTDSLGCLQALQQLVQLSPAAENLEPSHVLDVLHCAVKCGRSEALELLCRLPAAAQLSSMQLFEVLQEAMKHGSRVAAEAVCILCTNLVPVAMGLYPNQLSNVALSLAQLRGSANMDTLDSCCSALHAILQLPGIKAVPAAVVAELVVAYLKMRGILGIEDTAMAAFVGPLLDLLSTQQLDLQHLVKMVEGAVLFHMYGCAGLVLQLPAAWGVEVPTELLLVILQRIDSCSSMEAANTLVMQLLQLPCVLHRSEGSLYREAYEVVRLLERVKASRAIDAVLLTAQRQVVWLQQLLQLPRAAQVTVDEALSLLHYALQRQPAAAKVLCCMLPAVQHLNADNVRMLLTAAVTCPEQAIAETGGGSSSESAVGYLCALPAAQQLQPAALQRLLSCALLQDRPTALKCLAGIQQPAAGISKEELLELLRLALQRRSSMVSEALT
jgi:hypothetical protein